MNSSKVIVMPAIVAASLVPVNVGGRIVMLPVEKAEKVAIKKAQLEGWGEMVSQDLRMSRMLPNTRTNQFAGWIGTKRGLPYGIHG